MRLESGTPAPEFEATTITGAAISLSDYRGMRVWLSFFRYAACPLCSFRIHELMSQWDERFGRANLQLLTVWQSPEDKLQEVIERYHPPFPLITDPALELYKLYAVEKGAMKVMGKEVFSGMAAARKAGIPLLRAWDGPPTRRPADFLIGPDGTIETAFYGENVGQMIPLEDVEHWLGNGVH